MGIKTKFWPRLYCVLVIMAGLCLAACGSETVTTVSPTTQAATGPATVAATTAAATTAPATTAAPSTAAATTVPVSTSVTNTTTATTAGQAGSGSSKVQELFANIPETAEYLKELKYNNYAALRTLYKIPADATFEILQQDKDLFARFLNVTRFLDPAEVLKVNYFQTLRETAGYDLLQADYDAQAGIVPNYLSFVQGNFDAAAIDKAFTAGGATKASAGPNTSYTFEKVNLAQKLQTIFLGPLSLVVVPTQKILIMSKPPEAAIDTAGKLPSKTPIKDNVAVKALLAEFGDPLAIHLGTTLISQPEIPLQITPSSLRDTIKATQPVPVPLMVGYAYYEDSTGAKSYLVANYYADETSAKAAQPILENRLKTGTSQRTRAPYSQYWEVASSETKGNVLLFKLNWKQVSGLNQFIYNRDFPAFLV